jgi:outer membrane beta-barrel protein
MKRFPVVLLTLILLTPVSALAQLDDDDDGRNIATSLAEQPAVRHRLLLVKGRFELTPAFEANVNADYKYTLSGGLRAEYHLSDMLSVGAIGFYGVSLNTGLTDRILGTLPASDPDNDPTPTRDEYEQHLNDIPLHGAAYVSLTPWYGKLAAFGAAFVNFDFYFSAGVAFAQLKSECDGSVCNDDDPGGPEMIPNPDPDMPPILVPDNNPNDDPAVNSGNEPGLFLGGGIHVFLSNWLALDLSVRNYLFSNNPSGLDTNFDYLVSTKDNQLQNHLFLGVGLSVFFPLQPERTP